jgi:hypothetical protein
MDHDDRAYRRRPERSSPVGSRSRWHVHRRRNSRNSHGGDHQYRIRVADAGKLLAAIAPRTPKVAVTFPRVRMIVPPLVLQDNVEPTRAVA